MRRDQGRINPVYVQRDRRPLPGIAEPVNLVKSGLSKTTIAALPLDRTHRHGTAGLEHIFGFRQRMVANHVAAPGLMGMYRTELARPPNQRQNRKPPSRIAIDDVARIAMRRRLTLVRAHKYRDRGRAMEGRNHAVSHEVWWALAGGPHLGNQRHQGGMRMARGAASGPECGARAEHQSDKPVEHQ